MASQSAEVIIIGAGIAGITAANRLFASGYKNVKILEARDRIGGRIHTVCIGPEACTVELGAQWIHGGGDNPVYCAALAHDLLGQSNVHDEFAGAYYKENGTRVNKSLLKAVTAIFKDTVEEMVDISFSDTKSSLSCDEYLSNRMPSLFSSVPDDQKGDAENIFRSLLNILKEDSSADLTRLSLSYNGFEDDYRNDDFTIPAGYATLLRKLMSNFEPDVITLETQVKQIDWSEKENEFSPVVLKCVERGKEMTYIADHVISTIPLGVLKKNHQNLFNPVLPTEQAYMIEKLGFGKVDKILLYYSESFGTKSNGGIKLVWDKEADHEEGEASWARSLFAFKVMKHIDNVLIAWVYGDSAEQMEAMADTQVGEVCTQVLKQFLNDERIPKPTSVRTSKWCTDPYTLGAYSFVTSGCHYDDFDILSKPLLQTSGKPAVLFAGEATHSNNYASAHGAMLSGIREAERLIKWKLC